MPCAGGRIELQLQRRQLVQHSMPLLRSRWTAVERFFAGLGFERVELDPAGYRRGRLLALTPHGEG